MLITASIITLSLSMSAFAVEGESFTPEQMKWQPAPNALPKGAEATLLEGDPTKEGPFTLRLKMPAKYTIPPHWHPAIEHVTIISGELDMGMGGKFDMKAMKKLPVGSFFYMPAQMYHFVYAPTPTVVQLHGIGPWGITYVDPKDDPRNATTK